MIVRRDQQFVRRRWLALVLAVGALVLVVLATIRAFSAPGAAPHETARSTLTKVQPNRSAHRPAAATSEPSPGIPAPTRSPAARQGAPGPPADTALVQVLRLSGGLTPKSVVASHNGLVFAQNMMYTHTMSVFRADGAKIKTIPDSVDLAAEGVSGHPGTSKGSPVEMAFSPDDRTAWVSNYSMYGNGFSPEGQDACTSAAGISSSYVYQISTTTFTIDKVIRVGAVPKYVAATPDGKRVLVTNWCSMDLSVIDTATDKEIARIPMDGAHPRGIAVSPDSRTAYVAVMGSGKVVKVDLASRQVSLFARTGSGPRHIVISPDAKYLYVTNNGDGTITKLDRATGKILGSVHVGSEPRSMAISPDGAALYSVNYDSSTVSKVRASDLKVIDEVRTDAHPIGITYEPTRKAVWVACYGGTILVFDDSRRPVA